MAHSFVVDECAIGFSRQFGSCAHALPRSESEISTSTGSQWQQRFCVGQGGWRALRKG